MLLRTARRKGGAESLWRTLAPAISREDHSSFAPSAFACSIDAPALEGTLAIWSKTAKSRPKPARSTLCDEASAAMQEHGFKLVQDQHVEIKITCSCLCTATLASRHERALQCCALRRKDINLVSVA
ncbi:hypothetical protein DP120_14950 [Planococcus halotolerans]|uniref:Uncharacterized protein n=1 Tax=Planococcus halotolerans TaxID=2233542 RepID=A0A365KN79_9BACL|nr:hypothetical protein DP120_14950 [Planococcus halotolerans]